MESEARSPIHALLDELTAEAKTFGGILAASADAVWLFDAAGRCLFANQAAAKPLGLKPSDLIGKPLCQLGFPQDGLDAFDLQRLSVLGTGRPAVTETRLPSTGGPRSCECVMSPLFGDGGAVDGVVAVCREIGERRKADARLREAEEQLRALSLHTMQVQEAERRRIARELHDEIGQTLSIIKVNLQQLRRTADREAHEAMLDGSIEALGQALQQIRRLSHDLRPSILDDLGLAAALRWFFDFRLKDAGVTPRIRVDATGGRIPAPIETACFRVVQEALNNALCHARAASIALELRQTPERLRLTIEDDGAGFDLQAVRGEALRGSHLGLLGMQERIRAAGGRIRIDAAPGRGCRIEIDFETAGRPEEGR